MKKYVYLFEEGNAKMKSLLGGKGANLAEMTNIGLPVPYGFTITTEACNEYYVDREATLSGVKEQAKEALTKLEEKTGKKFGDPTNPLLVSVRSGAAISMPGMMDTILNLGLNDVSVAGLAAKTNNERFAYDCYRRFIQMFGDVVMEVDHYKFEEQIDAVKEKYGVEIDTDVTAEGWKEVIEAYKKVIANATGKQFPQDPMEQLYMAVEAVFSSWNNPRAKVYRKINKIPDDLGTAVNVQMMVFGNMGDDCATGVAFTRNPSTGEKALYGEYLINAQGEDVVAGIRTPKDMIYLKEEMPEAFAEFLRIYNLLENHYRDMQDIEFTIEQHKLYMLQTRTGKRTAAAAIKIAVDMVKEGLITKEEALLRVAPDQLDQLLHRRLDPSAKLETLAKGLPASPGAACGIVVFDADKAEELGLQGKKVILVRPETTPDDIHGIVQAQGILTSRGGMTSHAAVVARGMGKPCVCGCEALKIDLEKGIFQAGGATVKGGDLITIDGATGGVILGEVPTIEPTLTEEFKELLNWADEVRSLQVRTNADNPEDSAKAREFGAEGIGLCRTEHMFMAQDRLPAVQEMILADTEEERRVALAKILPMQKGDFIGIFKAMEGLPVTIRLLDPPLHEFLPDSEELTVEITKMKITGEQAEELEAKQTLLKKVRELHEFNPMLGHRGCRLGITYPEIYEMQAQAIMEAATELTKEGLKVIPEIEIPLVAHKEELRILREKVTAVVEEVIAKSGIKVEYTVGTMIEVPRACLVADEIAQVADFFAFGTNDLTQTTFGFSRDDAEGKFLGHYVDKKVLPNNPFQVLDRNGVGKLMDMAVKLGRGVKEGMKIGICGEHGGDPESIEFCHQVGLTYVSCSPYRVPIARLAAAQAKIKANK